jgi:hypothetical protein
VVSRRRPWTAEPLPFQRRLFLCLEHGPMVAEHDERVSGGGLCIEVGETAPA